MFDWIAHKVIEPFSSLKELAENMSEFLNLQKQLQNIPVFGWLAMKDMKTSKRNSCSIYPDILNDIEYRNTYWQIFRNHGSTFHLYGAYFGKTNFSKNSLTKCQTFLWKTTEHLWKMGQWLESFFRQEKGFIIIKKSFLFKIHACFKEETINAILSYLV